MAGVVQWLVATVLFSANFALIFFIWKKRNDLKSRINNLDSSLLDSNLDIEEVIQAPYGSRIVKQTPQNVNPNQMVMLQLADGRVISLPYHQAVQMARFQN